jgi:hypothetical protein
VHAAAFVVGPRDGAGAALADLARSIGFGSVERYQGLAKAERHIETTPLMFFLCAAVADVKTLKPMVDAIRFSPSLKLRFSPLIYFARDLSLDTIKQCISIGFDDVIALPYAAGDLGERIGRQVGQTQIYYETATYFGPDRRNRTGEVRSVGSDRGGGQYRRIEIRRTPEHGTDVLRDDLQVVL